MPAYPLSSVLVPAFATGLATTAGALPFLKLDAVSRRAYDTLLGLGAGLMLAAATLGLLAAALADVRVHDQVDLGQLAVVLGGLLCGVAVLFVMDRYIPHDHAGGHHVHVRDDGSTEIDVHAGDARTARMQGLLVVGVMALHRLPEGLAIGAAYAAGGSTLGLTLVVAVGVQNAVEGVVMAAPLRRGGLPGSAIVALVAATGLAVPLGAVCGFYASSQVTGALPAMLALAAGALLYLTCNEVIPESHSHGNEVRATFGVVTGFIIIIVVQAVFGHHH